MTHVDATGLEKANLIAAPRGQARERYGDRLAGWMSDDELIYYPAPYEQLGEAAKAGNKSRIISYNPWIQARGTDFQDIQFGGLHWQ